MGRCGARGRRTVSVTAPQRTSNLIPPVAATDLAPPNALDIDSVSHSYGPRKALDDVTLHVPQGRFIALLGPNGAGKTTLFSLITRLFATQRGSIRIFGQAVDRDPGEALRMLGVVFQARTLDLDLSVMDNLCYHAALHGIGPRQARQRASVLLCETRLQERTRDPVRKLSGGQMRRLEIARALLHRPQLLLLDEPTVGLDVASKWAIVGQVRALVQQQGVTVLWATHLLDEVEGEDTLFVLNQGRIVAHDDAAGIVRASGAADLRGAFTSLTEPA
jgi:ABC-2 type transport system ATP-binding protein